MAKGGQLLFGVLLSWYGLGAHRMRHCAHAASMSSALMPSDHVEEEGGQPVEDEEVTVTGEIVACAGCGLEELPELWSFLVAGEVDYYHGVQKTWTKGGPKQAILTVYNRGRYVDSVVLSEDASWTIPDYHNFFQEKGFRIKDAEGRKSAKEAAEKDIRDEAAWRRYRIDYFDRRSRHVFEFMTLVLKVQSKGSTSCSPSSSPTDAVQVVSPIPGAILESNYDRNNPVRLHYVRTGRWPKRKRRTTKGGSSPTVDPTSSTESTERNTHESDANPKPSSAFPSSEFYPLYEKPSSYLILQQRKADIVEKLRAIKRKRIALQPSDAGPQTATTTKPTGRRSQSYRQRQRHRPRRKSPIDSERGNKPARPQH